MTKLFQIEVKLGNGHSNQYFNRFEGGFVKDADGNTSYQTSEAAISDLDVARAAWNEFDEIAVVEVTVEGE